MAFHLISEDPGSLIHLSPEVPKDTIADMLLDPPKDWPTDQFLSTLEGCAEKMENKIHEIADLDHNSILVDTVNLELRSGDLERWQSTVVDAPSATDMKIKSGKTITSTKLNSYRDLVKAIAGAMAYDKHGRLDLILYSDGHEELRKLARKSIWTLKEDDLAAVVQTWLPRLHGHQFSINVVSLPSDLKRETERAATIVRESFPELSFKHGSSGLKEQDIVSLHQLIIDLSKLIVRCSREETFVTTTLFLFLTLVRVTPKLHLLSRVSLNATCMQLLKT